MIQNLEPTQPQRGVKLTADQRLMLGMRMSGHSHILLISAY